MYIVRMDNMNNKEKIATGKAALTKERITKTAEKMFIEKGYVATTLRDIAANSGVTTGAFYKHYGSKEEVLISIFNDGFTRQWEKFYELKEDITPITYAQIIGEINNGLADVFGTELLKVYCTAQIEMGNSGSLWKILDSEKYSRYEQMLLENLVNRYSTNYSWNQVDDIVAKIDRGVILDWILKQGSYNLGEETNEMLLIVFKVIFDKYNWQ